MQSKDYVLRQYGTKNNLQTRIGVHKLYSQVPILFTDWALNQIELTGSVKALDAGCGSGGWLFPLAKRLEKNGGSVVGLDLSQGMLSDIQSNADEYPNIELQVGDVQNLPFADASFDFVMANFMLYHVPDIHQAVKELNRVLKPGGQFMAATNSRFSMETLWKVIVECLRKAEIPEPVVQRSIPTVSFSLENGSDFLRPHFPWFESRLLYDVLKFSESQPLMDYCFSLMRRGDAERQVPDEQWQLAYRFVREEVENGIRRDGHFSVPKTAGFFIARK